MERKKSKMKRILGIVLALCLLFAVAACATEAPAPVAPAAPAPADPAPADPTPADPTPVDPGPSFDENWKIAIVTNTMDQNEEEFRSAQATVLKYGEDRVIHRVWPTLFTQEPELMISILGNIAADQDVKAIIINQAVINTNAAIDRVRQLRGDDVFIVVCSPAENVEDVAVRADLILQPNDPLNGVRIAEQAKAMGADTIGHYSFERHLAAPTIALRREIMMEKAAELGMNFVDLVAPDPTVDGTPATQMHIMQDVPRQVEELGVNTAFFGTNCAMQAPMQIQVVETGAIYPIPCCPSPYHRFPETFNIDWLVGTGVFVEDPDNPDEEIEIMDWLDLPTLVNEIKAAVADKGATGRLATWPMPASFMWTTIGAEYAIEWITGNAPQEVGVIDLDLLNTLAEDYTELLYGERIGVDLEPFEFQGTLYNHWVMGIMDFLVF